MMSNLRLLLVSAASGGLFCGFVGAVIGAVARRGTSVLLPGLGLVISGPLAAGFVCGLTGVIFGSMIGLLAAAAIILTRRNPYP